MTLEYRSIDTFNTDDEGNLSGQAIVFGKESVDFGGWTEVISRDALEFVDDIVLDFDHNSEYILARQSNQTLNITIDDAGVSFRAVPPKTSWVQDLIVSMRGGYIKGCSFLFECLDDEWSNVAGKVMRTVTKARVHALTITGEPAYPQTSSEARSKYEALLKTPEIPSNDAEPIVDLGAEEHSSDVETRSVSEPEYICTKRYGIIKIIGKE